MDFIILFFVPILISVIPLLAFLFFKKKTRGMNSFNVAILIGIGSIVLGFISPFIATLVADQKVSSILPGFRPNCILEAGVFFPIGGFFTLLTILLVINFLVKSYKRKKFLVNKNMYSDIL